MAERQPTQHIIGEAPAFLAMLEHVSRAAPLDRSVLVVGERGTGKELIASRLHFLSERWEQSVVKVNCAALPLTLLESELFGYEKGAFTGAVKFKPGKFELASDGVILLDEIGRVYAPAQLVNARAVQAGDKTWEVEIDGQRRSARHIVIASGAYLVWDQFAPNSSPKPLRFDLMATLGLKMPRTDP